VPPETVAPRLENCEQGFKEEACVPLVASKGIIGRQRQSLGAKDGVGYDVELQLIASGELGEVELPHCEEMSQFLL
jgi:hypothetical protein